MYSTIFLNESKSVRPTSELFHLFPNNIFHPLRAGSHNLISQDARVTYHELADLIAAQCGWDIDHVRDNLQLRMYCSSFIKHPSGDSRTFWSTESRYPYGDHARKDFVEISMGDGHVGLAQVVSFLHLTHLPPEETHLTKDLMLVRWLSPSSLSNARDSCNRPLCDYPLSHNFCLWEWSRIPVRLCYRQRGFRRVVHRQKIWHHIKHQGMRSECIDSESRAYYDVIEYETVLKHANVARDPSTGHMLQSIHIL